MQLRWYQREALDEILEYLRFKTGNPCVVLPTGAGKTPLLAQLCIDSVQQWQGRVLVVSHVKELVEQAARSLQAMCPTIPVGIYSAGLNRRDLTQDVIVGGVQSICNRAEQLGRFDLLIIDEAHLIPETGEGQYRTLINGLMEINPDIRILGLTATPYRTGSGPLCGEGKILTEIIYDAPIKRLIDEGYLCRIVGRAGLSQIETQGIKLVAGEYDNAQLVQAYASVLDAAIPEIIANATGRKSILVFCQSIEQSEYVAGKLREFGESVGEIYGHTPAEDRADRIDGLKDGTIRWMINVNVLTTGFDARNIDCIVLLRSTYSPGLYYQMVGRGLRIHDAKENCLILDYGTNIERHGPIDAMTTEVALSGEEKENKGKVCPECREVVNAAVKVCPCGYVWPVREREDKTSTLSKHEPLAGSSVIEKYDVAEVSYKIHRKKDGDEFTPKTLRVTYRCGLATFYSEWICLEHEGFVQQRAHKWWRERCKFPLPQNVAEGWLMAVHGLLAEPYEIEVEKKAGEKFPRIVKHELGPKPEFVKACPACLSRERELHEILHDKKNGGAVACAVCLHTFETISIEDYEVISTIEQCDDVDYFGLVPMWPDQVEMQSEVEEENPF